VGSGLPPVPFFFGGFLPSSRSSRREEFLRASALGITCVYFESPHRIAQCLRDLATVAPGSAVCVARELTKIHEDFRHGTPGDLQEYYTENPPKGEITLVIHWNKVSPSMGEGSGKEGDYSEKTPIPRNLA